MYESKILDELMKLMDADKWHVKLMRWFRLQYWIIRCNLRKKGE
jgi:hypothetical protein